MGAESKKRVKELLGKPSVLGYDVLSQTATGLSGVVGHTRAGDVETFTVPKDGLIDYFVVNVYPTIDAGTLSVALSQDGTVVASGDLTSASNSARLESFFNKESGTEKTLASGDVLEVNYAISSALSLGVTTRAFNARVGLRYREAE